MATPKVLYSEEVIDQVCRMAAQWMTYRIRGIGDITSDDSMGNPIALVMMTGGMFFASKVLQMIEEPIEVDYIHASRYGCDKEGGAIAWVRRPPLSVHGRNVFILDDIYDEGITLNDAHTKCKLLGALRVKTVVLCTKEGKKDALARAVDFNGVRVPNKWIFGCGMDYDGHYRNSPKLYYLEEHDDN